MEFAKETETIFKHKSATLQLKQASCSWWLQIAPNNLLPAKEHLVWMYVLPLNSPWTSPGTSCP